MKKIIAAVMAAATFTSALSMTAFAKGNNTTIDSTMFTSARETLDISKTGTILVGTDNAVKDVVVPGKSLFVQIPATTLGNNLMNDKDNYTYKIKATEGAKHVAGYAYFVGKTDLKAKGADNVAGTVNSNVTLGGRQTYIEVKLKDNFTDAENKIRLELDIKAKNGNSGTVTFVSPYIYVGNTTEDGTDLDIAAGTVGKMFKPVKNEDNQIVWNDELRDIARLTFFADSDVAKTYPKLNTKWTESDYADYFADQDAYLFEFVSNPYVSSTSRATLEIYNPYYDEDTDTVIVDPADVIIYQVTEDSLVDVTELFKHGENEDGDLVFTIKTRQLGTYIFAEAEATVETEEEEEVVTPDDIKTPVDTGR